MKTEPSMDIPILSVTGLKLVMATAVSCDPDAPTPETTAADAVTTAAPETEEPTETPTEAPTEEATTLPPETEEVTTSDYGIRCEVPEVCYTDVIVDSGFVSEWWD